jgi:hypothetical protein
VPPSQIFGAPSFRSIPFSNDAVGGPAADQATVKLFDRAAGDVLLVALTEQEAAAFSASWNRYLKSAANAGATGTSDVLPIGAADQLKIIDEAVDARGLGLRGKLRARRLLLDCLARSTPRETQAAGQAESSECSPSVKMQIASMQRITLVSAETALNGEGPAGIGQ